LQATTTATRGLFAGAECEPPSASVARLERCSYIPRGVRVPLHPALQSRDGQDRARRRRLDRRGEFDGYRVQAHKVGSAVYSRNGQTKRFTSINRGAGELWLTFPASATPLLPPQPSPAFTILSRLSLRRGATPPPSTRAFPVRACANAPAGACSLPRSILRTPALKWFVRYRTEMGNPAVTGHQLNAH